MSTEPMALAPCRGAFYRPVEFRAVTTWQTKQTKLARHRLARWIDEESMNEAPLLCFKEGEEQKRCSASELCKHANLCLG